MFSTKTEATVLTASEGEHRPPEVWSERSSLRAWVGLVLLLLITARFAVRAAGPVTDPDTWWHLRLGEEFLGDWSLSDPGQLSSFATRPWFATQWTLEILASLVEDTFGLAGISWLAGIAVVVLSVTIYISCRQRAGVLPAAAASAVALLGTSMSHGPRPQLASFILVAVVTLAWLRSIDDGKPRWWLVPVTWLWACTHGMWFIGVAVGLGMVLGMVLDGRVDRRGAVRLAAVPILSVVAAGLTPVGPKLLLAPLATSSMAQFVTEWQPPDFSEKAPAAAAFMVAVVVATWARRGKTSWTDLLLLASAAGWVLLYSRTVAVGAVIAAPLFARVIQSWLPIRQGGAPLRGERLAVAIAAGLCAIGLALLAPHVPEGSLERADELNAELERLPEGTVVFNEYVLGGWLEWRHRNLDPVVDGMTDAYEVEYMADYISARRLEPGWHGFIERVGAEYALMEEDAAMRVALTEREDWTLVVEDQELVLFKRTGR